MARPPTPSARGVPFTPSKCVEACTDHAHGSATRMGRPRLVSATGTTRAAAERALQQVPATRTAPTGDLITADTRLAKLADLWLTFLRAEGRIEQTTVNEYERVLRRVVLPQLGGIRIREATTGRLERFIVDVRSRSENRQRKAKVVLGVPRRAPSMAVGPARTGPTPGRTTAPHLP
jgi:hypothetical protein